MGVENRGRSWEGVAGGEGHTGHEKSRRCQAGPWVVLLSC